MQEITNHKFADMIGWMLYYFVNFMGQMIELYGIFLFIIMIMGLIFWFSRVISKAIKGDLYK